jgi:hypothetical protein
MHVREGLLRHAAVADGADSGALRERRSLRDRHRTEMGEGHGEGVGSEDRHRAAARGDAAGERHRPGRRGQDVDARRGGPDVDAAVLAADVRVRRVEGEGCEHRALHRPGPGAGCGHAHRQEDEENRETTSHVRAPSVVRVEDSERATIEAASAVVKADYSEPR